MGKTTMKLLMHEVLQKVSNTEKTKEEKIALLEKFNAPALRMLFIINFDDSIISLLPLVKFLTHLMMHQQVQSILN